MSISKDSVSSNKIFISYCHEDLEYLSDLKKYINPIIKKYNFEIWDDTKILSGQKLFEIIKHELNSFNLMICLISSDYLGSKACMEELDISLEKAKNSDVNHINIFPIIVRSCSWKHSDIGNFKCQPKDGNPISKLLKENHKDDVYTEIADSLAKTLDILKKNFELEKAEISNKTVSENLFCEYINGLGVKIKHPKKDVLYMEDIYVYPDIKDIGNENVIQKPFYDVNDIIERYRLMCFMGTEEIGKTSLCKKLSKNYMDRDQKVVLLTGQDIDTTDPKKLIKKFIKKYKLNHLLDSYENSVLIIDNFSHIKMNSRYIDDFLTNVSDFFSSIILMIDKNNIVDYQIKLSNNNFSLLEILPFGHTKRNEFVQKWLLIGEENLDIALNNDVLYKLDHITSQFESIMKKNIMDSKPIYLTTIIQLLDGLSNYSDKFTLTSFGHCYQVLIMGMLNKADIDVRQDSDGILNFLGYLSFEFYKKDIKEINNGDFDNFCDNYSKNFNIPKNIKQKLLKSGIIYRDLNDIIRFSQNYLYYFCCAKYIADNFSNHSNEITLLCENIHNENKANILIFLVHHFRDDKILLNEVLTHSIYALEGHGSFYMSTEDNKKFINILGNTIKDIVWKEKDIINERKKILQRKESLKDEDSIFENSINEDNKEMQDLKFQEDFQDIFSALRSLEVIGQIAKNRNSSIALSSLSELLEISYDIGLRILGFYLESFSSTYEDIKEMIKEILASNKNIATQSDIAEEVESLIRNFSFNICFHIIKLIAKNTAHANLINNSKELARSKDIPAYKLILLASQLNIDYQLPKELIMEMSEEFRSNPLAYSLLRSLIVHHSYIYDLDYKDIQWICDKLDIDKEQIYSNKENNFKSLQMQ